MGMCGEGPSSYKGTEVTDQPLCHGHGKLRWQSKGMAAVDHRRRQIWRQELRRQLL